MIVALENNLDEDDPSIKRRSVSIDELSRELEATKH